RLPGRTAVRTDVEPEPVLEATHQHLGVDGHLLFEAVSGNGFGRRLATRERLRRDGRNEDGQSEDKGATGRPSKRLEGHTSTISRRCGAGAQLVRWRTTICPCGQSPWNFDVRTPASYLPYPSCRSG